MVTQWKPNPLRFIHGLIILFQFQIRQVYKKSSVQMAANQGKATGEIGKRKKRKF
jgi:hypothetical protein